MRRGFLKGLAVAALFSISGAAFAQDTPDPENILVLEIAGGTSGQVEILLRPDIAPLHVARIKELTRSGQYDGVAFHRVIDGFMAQTGDVQYGRADTYDVNSAGYGGSDMDNVPAEISDLAFDTGVVGMARGRPLDSANSQFFIMLTRYPSLDGIYTVFGRVIAGMDIVHGIKRGDQGENGKVLENPDYVLRAWIKADE